MTEQEASALVEWFKCRRGKTLKLNDNGVDCVIEALEKQIARKPEFVGEKLRNLGSGRKISDDWSIDKCYKCPSCHSRIFHVFDGEEFCKYCGQRLDWSEE